MLVFISFYFTFIFKSKDHEHGLRLHDRFVLQTSAKKAQDNDNKENILFQENGLKMFIKVFQFMETDLQKYLLVNCYKRFSLRVYTRDFIYQKTKSQIVIIPNYAPLPTNKHQVEAKS